ncbi:MAG: ATP-binding protein [Bacillota bacterium]|nr:ATP-binding protein [Bacillota bacterium]
MALNVNPHMKRKLRKARHSRLLRLPRALWRAIAALVSATGALLERASRRLSLSISFKITFAFVALAFVLISLFGGPSRIALYIFALPPLAIFGRRAVAYLLRPITEMTQTASRLAKPAAPDTWTHERINVAEAQDELRELALMLNAMLDRLEASVAEQRRFIDHAAHELRTPLAVISGYGDLLDRWGKSEPAVRDESIAAIRNEAGRMSILVDRLLQLSRIDAGRTALRPETVSLPDLIERSAEAQRVLHGQRLRIETDTEPLTVTGDALLLGEVLAILADNACRYTPDGGLVRLSCHRVDGTATLTVRDSGIGIEADTLPHLFEPFRRGERARAHNSSGSGLGLAIARRILDLHGAHIRVASEVGEGTLMTVEFPS